MQHGQYLRPRLAVLAGAAKTVMLDTMTPSHIDFMLSKIPRARLLQVEEATAMVAWLASEECSFSTGAMFDLSEAERRTSGRGSCLLLPLREGQ